MPSTNRCKELRARRNLDLCVIGSKRPTLWFNNATERNQRWADAALRATYGYQVRYPEAGQDGVSVEFAACKEE